MSVNVQHKTIELDRLDLYPKNPRKGSVATVRASLETFGQYRTIVVRPHADKDGYEVLAGNHTLMAAREIGMKTLDCSVVEVDDDTAARIVLADNRSSDLAEYDDTELLELLNSLETLEGTGYSGVDLSELTAELEEALKPPKSSPLGRPDSSGITIPPEEKSKFNTRDQWEDSTRRLIVLDFSTEEFLEATALLSELGKAYGTTSNTATILRLLRLTVDDGR